MTKTIINREVLFTCKLNLEKGDELSLCKEFFSDGRCFYTLEDSVGNYKLAYISPNIYDLINELEWEMKVDLEIENLTSYKENEAIRKVCDEVKKWRMEIIECMKKVENNLFADD